MSMFTSLYPSVHGVQTVGGYLGQGVPTLAQCLAQMGYLTQAFVLAPALDHRFGFDRGFQFYDDFTAEAKGTQIIHPAEGGIAWGRTNPVITDLATQWLKKHSGENFFLFLHYFDCHSDYFPPPPFDKKFDPDYDGGENGRGIAQRAKQGNLMAQISVRDLAHMEALYDGGIAYTDEHVGKILQLLQDLRLSEKTLVIVLSDHGEAFLEHGLIYHGNSLYEEELHAPLIMRLPGVIPAGKRVAGNVSHVDLMPTALGLLHLACPSQVQGIDLSPMILSDKPVPERLIYSELAEFGFNLRAVRWGHRKLLGAPGTLAGAQLEEVAGSREKAIADADLKKACPEAALRALATGPPSILLESRPAAEPPRAAKRAPATQYNLLLISIDTCRADHLKCYGYNQDTSPHLDQLAREGVLFENLTAAASWTRPSHMTMFTSLYPSVHGVQNVGDQIQLGEGVPTLARCLAENGYVTAAFVTGPVLNHRWGFNRGFQLYDDFTVSQLVPNVEEHVPGHLTGLDHQVTNPVITNLATQWLKEHSGENFFLFLHYWDCHNDYLPPAPFDRKFDPEYKGKEDGRGIFFRQKDITAYISVMDLAHIVALYDGSIAYTDEHVGKILQLLQDLRLSEKTLVIVLSDHGEAFLEHGRLLHGNTLYEEEVHVPMIMRLPGVIPAGKRVAGNVSHVDLMPTALGLLQVAAPPKIQGIDLSPMILGDKPLPERLIYSELSLGPFNLRAVRWDNRKLLGTTGTLAGAQLEEVLGGREKVIADADLKKHCPEAALRAFTMGPPSIPEAKAAKASEPPDPDLIRRLKSLGYTE
jgi:arylsulfatase